MTSGLKVTEAGQKQGRSALFLVAAGQRQRRRETHNICVRALILIMNGNGDKARLVVG